MGILDNKTDSVLELKQDVMHVRKLSQNMYQNISRQLEQSFTIVWNNSKGFTPQEVLDEFGSDAKDLFVYSAQLQQILKVVNPAYEIIEPPYDYTINADGTVTVNYPVEDDNPSE